jgi:transcription-repair coupling factor (superfamily II helicase)
VGYDLYVQLVAEAVADAKGVVVPEVVSVNLDVPGDAHLPKNYVEADDARLEAYRRLANATTSEELADLGDEWIDRYGALPPAARGLLELGELRLRCLALGVTTLAVLSAKVGVRSKPVLRLGPLTLSLSQQLRLRRRYGSRSYDEATKELRVELTSDVAPGALLVLLDELLGASAD